MGKLVRLCCTLSFVMTFIAAFSQKTVPVTHRGDPIGRFISKDGLELIISADSAVNFIRLKNPMYDAALSNCDTIAKGRWHYLKNDILRLENDSDVQNVAYHVQQSNRFSEDSIYIKIVLPNDQGFFNGRFIYELSFVGKIENLESNNYYITFLKQKVFYSDNDFYHFGLTIHDLSPLNCTTSGFCFQRIYFKIFDDIRVNSKSNYFVITLPYFNECFVERMDLGNELLIIDKNMIYWRDQVFTKRK